MATARPFAYNTGSTIPGTEQLGDLSIGAPTSGFTDNPQYWNGPDEDPGYVIGYTVTAGDQPNPVGIPAYVQFWRSKLKTDQSFLDLANYIGLKNGQLPFANVGAASTWLTANGYYTSFVEIVPTTTPTPTPTLTQTPTSTDLTSVTTYTISGCTSLNVFVANLGPGALAPGDVFYFDFTGGTPSGCYRIVNKINTTPTDGTTPLYFYSNCALCVAAREVTPTPTPTITQTPTQSVTPTPSVTNTQTPTNTSTLTPTPTPTNPTLLQILNQTTGGRTVTSFTLDGTTQPLSSGSYPITAGNNGYALTHGTNSNPNGVVFNFGGSGAFDLYSYVNGNLVNYLSSYNNSTYTMGGLTLQTSDQLLLRITDPGFLSTPTPTASVTTTSTPTPSVTNTQTPSTTPTITPTTTTTPTVTPTPSTSPVPVTGYSFNLVALPYNFPSSGNTIMVDQTTPSVGTTNPNLMAIQGNGIYFSAIDSDGVDRTSYFASFTGQSITITMSQSGSTAIYSGSTNAFQSWSGNTGDIVSPVPGKGFNFNYGVAQAGYTSGTTVLIQSATTNWVTGQTVTISAVINGAGVTPTPTATSVTPTPTPTSGATTDGWLFYYPEGPLSVGPPTSNGNIIFVGSGSALYNPNYTGTTLNLYFNNNNNVGTSYASQFSGLDTTGGTITMSQGSNTAIYSGTSSEYSSSGTFLNLGVTRPEQMIQSASTPFVSGTTINVVVS